MICRPCERRLNNAIVFKDCIAEMQKTLEEDTRSKRCIEESPSAIKLAPKVLASESRHRSIDFSGAGASAEDESQHDTLTTPTVNCLHLRHSTFLSSIFIVLN